MIHCLFVFKVVQTPWDLLGASRLCCIKLQLYGSFHARQAYSTGDFASVNLHGFFLGGGGSQGGLLQLSLGCISVKQDHILPVYSLFQLAWMDTLANT